MNNITYTNVEEVQILITENVAVLIVKSKDGMGMEFAVPRSERSITVREWRLDKGFEDEMPVQLPSTLSHWPYV